MKPYHMKNFATLQRAMANGDVCLLECTEADGKKVVAICAVQTVDGMEEFLPLAKLFDCNPFENLNPPNLEQMQ